MTAKNNEADIQTDECIGYEDAKKDLVIRKLRQMLDEKAERLRKIANGEPIDAVDVNLKRRTSEELKENRSDAYDYLI